MTATVIAGIIVVAIVAIAVEVTGRRQAITRADSPVVELLGNGEASKRATATYGPVPRGLIVLTSLAAIAGLLAAGIGAASRDDAAARNRGDIAQAHRQTCLSIVAANERKAVGIVLAAGLEPRDTNTATLPDDLKVVVAELHLPRSLGAIRDEGRARIVAALLDDARIGSKTRPICPFTAGDADLTPDTPVDSATTALEQRIAGDPSTPTTGTTTTTTP